MEGLLTMTDGQGVADPLPICIRRRNRKSVHFMGKWVNAVKRIVIGCSN